MGGADVPGTLQAMEDSNCRLPMRLEDLQGRWRKQKVEVVDWPLFFECLGATRPEYDSISSWLGDTEAQAEAKGPKYGGAKGNGKGNNQGKGQGKGKGEAQAKGKGGGSKGRAFGCR